MSLLSPILPIVRHHHERWDGTGYPDGRAGRDIPLLARIVGLADAFVAMTHDRPYRLALPPEKVLHELQHNAGRQFDPDLVALLLQIHPFEGPPA
jgi:HD-GYP domain-containing protein (c-di-GMP phosphodiesterase class II)